MNYKHVRTISSFLLALTFIGFLVTCVLYIKTKSLNLLLGGVFLCLAFFISGVVLGLFSVRLERKIRTKELEKISERLGWNFDPQPEKLNFLKGIPESLNVEFLGSLLEGRTQNLITGKIQDLDFAVFDQIYLENTGEDKYERVVTLFILNNKQLRLPVFCCEPKKSWHKFFNFFFKKDIMFENYPKFSQKYRLYGPNEIAVRQTFNPKLLTYFQQKTPLTTIGAENYLIVYKQNSVCPPEEILERLNKTVEMANLF